jgi:aromatic-amino-acid transaminase
MTDERVGNLCVIVNDAHMMAVVQSHLPLLIRANYLTPPSHGCRIVHMMLTQPHMRQQW